MTHYCPLLRGRARWWVRARNGTSAASRARRFHTAGSRGASPGGFGDGDHVPLGAEEQDAVGGGGGGHGDFAEGVGGDAVVGRAGLEDVDLAVLAGEVELVAGDDRGGGEADAAFDALAVVLLAGAGVEAGEDAVVLAA